LLTTTLAPSRTIHPHAACPHIFPSPRTSCFRSLAVVHATLWVLLVLIAWQQAASHSLSKLNGYLNFHRATRLWRKIPLYTLTVGNTALLAFAVVWETDDSQRLRAARTLYRSVRVPSALRSLKQSGIAPRHHPSVPPSLHRVRHPSSSWTRSCMLPFVNILPRLRSYYHLSTHPHTFTHTYPHILLSALTHQPTPARTCSQHRARHVRRGDMRIRQQSHLVQSTTIIARRVIVPSM
jgi:hypothetical protein